MRLRLFFTVASPRNHFLYILAARIFAPRVGTVPAYATSLALCYVALLMIRGLPEIGWDDLTQSAPAVFTAITWPFAFPIAHGIAFVFITYTAIKILAAVGATCRQWSP